MTRQSLHASHPFVLSLLVGVGAVYLPACGGSEDSQAAQSAGSNAGATAGTAGAATGGSSAGGNGGSNAGASGNGGAGASAGTSGSGGSTGGNSGAPSCVVDGVVSGNEECDDGNDQDGDGCNNNCQFTCHQTASGDAHCSDEDPCNGTEACGSEHVCVGSDPLADGTPCGTNKVCKQGTCGDVLCGDGFVSDGEECDDGNLVSGDGCDNCLFSCVDGDPNRGCDDDEACNGTETCDDTTHTCSLASPLPDGTVCGADDLGTCQSGACVLPVCGNSFVETGESCDDGNLVEGDGCDSDCTVSCSDPTIDCAAPLVCQIATCSGSNTCLNVPDVAQNGTTCGANLICSNGACVAPGAVCGNGIVETGEDCDFGASNGPGTGCEVSCLFSCTASPDSCSDGNDCNGVESCSQVMLGGSTGQHCVSGTPVADCTACGGTGMCLNQVCGPSSCGDGCVDASAGEQCEPPNTPTCDSSCQTVVIPVCGNGIREGAEQCDDSNTTNLDGCDAQCKFEQDQRVNWLKMQFSTDQYCTKNQFGTAITGSTIQSQFTQALDAGVADGSLTIAYKILGLDDLSGTSDAQLNLGFVNATPQIPAAGSYSGTNDLDYWYTSDVLSLDAQRNPTSLFPGSISAKVLTAGPGTINIVLLLAGSPGTLKMTNSKLQVTVGTVSTPLSSAGDTPGHLSSEHVDPALQSFVSTGQPNANGSGKLCGNITAESLSKVPIPMALTGGGLVSCSQNYSATNSMLDVLIGGCTILFAQQIKPTQPDATDPTVPPAGAGGPYTLSANSLKVVTTCRDKNNATVPLADCLKSAAYSSFFKFTTDRVILK